MTTSSHARSYDPVGNYERVRVSVTGSGESLIQPLLDNQLERQHQALGAKPPVLSTDLTLEQCVTLVKVCEASILGRCAGEVGLWGGLKWQRANQCGEYVAAIDARAVGCARPTSSPPTAR